MVGNLISITYLRSGKIIITRICRQRTAVMRSFAADAAAGWHVLLHFYSSTVFTLDGIISLLDLHSQEPPPKRNRAARRAGAHQQMGTSKNTHSVSGLIFTTAAALPKCSRSLSYTLSPGISEKSLHQIPKAGFLEAPRCFAQFKSEISLESRQIRLFYTELPHFMYPNTARPISILERCVPITNRNIR